MYRYFIKIFFRESDSRKNNRTLVFPFLASILSTIIPVITYCIISTMEMDIANKVISVYDKSTIHIYGDFNPVQQKYNEIIEYLESKGKKAELRVKQNAVLNYYDSFGDRYSKSVIVFGVSDRSNLINQFNLSLNSSGFDSNTILIGDKLASSLNFPNNLSKMTIVSPLDANFLIPYKSFTYIDQNFSFNKINAIDDFSAKYVFIDYNEAQKLFQNTSSYLGVDAILNSKEIKYLEDRFKGFEYSDWRNIYPLFFEAINMEKNLYTSFGFIVIIIAGFNLYGVINLIFYRKKNQLASLLYMGFSLKNIKKMFLLNVLIIGILGFVVGSIISLVTLHYGLIGYFLPILSNVDIFYEILPIVFFFNIVLLSLSVYFSITKKSLKVGGLSSSVLRN